jgi:hypothetical protein
MTTNTNEVPVVKIQVSDNAVEYGIGSLKVGWNGLGLYSVGTIAVDSLNQVEEAIQATLNGNDVRVANSKSNWLLLAADSEEADGIFIVSCPEDVPVAFYQGGRWFLPQ